MKHRFGSGFVAILATASIVLAGGEGEDKKGEKKTDNTRTLERLASSSNADPKLSAKAGKGFTVDLGDDFSVTISNYVQVMWRYAQLENTENENGFHLRRVRTSLNGHLFNPGITYGVQMDWTQSGGDNNVKDAWARWSAWNSEDGNSEIGLRIGQFKPHHGREFETSSSMLEHTERSLATRNFSESRVLGARVEGSHMEGKKLNWGVAVVNNDPADNSAVDESGDGADNDDNELNFIFDLRFDPMGDMGYGVSQGDLEHSEELKASIGASLLVGNHRLGGMDVETTSININGVVKTGGIHGLAEVFIRTDDGGAGVEADSTGWSAAASYALAHEEGSVQWSPALRISMIENSDPGVALNLDGLGMAEGDVTELTGSLNAYYHEHKLKTQVSYTFQSVSPDGGTDTDNHIIDIMFQWKF